MEINAETLEFVRACNGLWKYVEKGGADACWLWIGAKNAEGYGQIRIQGALVYAHRMTFMLENGFIPGSICVLHRCDTPLCVRPSHLFPGTKADNTADMMAKGRYKVPHPKLDPTKVAEIKRLLSAGTRQFQIAKMYDLTQQQVCNIAHGRAWGWVEAGQNG